jgi:predicted phage replisome organizer
MAEEKRYFWLRLYDDFFGSFRIKKLRKMAGGDTYVIIYLKMQLKAMKTDGVLQYRGLGTDFVDELAIDIDEEPDDVRVTLMYLLSCGLAETNDQKTFFFPFSVANTGSETSSAQRMREARKKAKEIPENNVRTLCEHRYGEIEKDIELDTEIDTEKENNKPIYLSGENSDDDPGAELRKRVEESMKRIEQRRANG